MGTMYFEYRPSYITSSLLAQPWGKCWTVCLTEAPYMKHGQQAFHPVPYEIHFSPKGETSEAVLEGMLSTIASLFIKGQGREPALCVMDRGLVIATKREHGGWVATIHMDIQDRTDAPPHIAPMRVEVDADELAAIRADHARLTARVTELLEHNTRLVMERRSRDLRTMVRAERAACGIEPVERPRVPEVLLFRAMLGNVAQAFIGVLCASLENGEDVPGETRLDRRALDNLLGLVLRAPLDIHFAHMAQCLANLDHATEVLRQVCGVDGGPLAHATHLYWMASANCSTDDSIKKPAAILAEQGWRE